MWVTAALAVAADADERESSATLTIEVSRSGDGVAEAPRANSDTSTVPEASTPRPAWKSRTLSSARFMRLRNEHNENGLRDVLGQMHVSTLPQRGRIDQPRVATRQFRQRVGIVMRGQTLEDGLICHLHASDQEGYGHLASGRKNSEKLWQSHNTISASTVTGRIFPE